MLQQNDLILKRAFAKGPSLHVSIIPDEKSIFKILLSESKAFGISFYGNIPSYMIEKILFWIESYINHSPTPNISFPRKILPSFSEKVLDVLSGISFGKTLSYQEIAILAESPRACRAVGTICRTNPWPLLIPCHRILPKDGSIGQYAFGSSLKKNLLQFEGLL